MGNDHVRVVAHREVRATAEQVESVLRDPGSYPSWVEGLVRFEPSASGCYIGELGYLGRRKRRLLRRASSERTAIAWETCDPDPNRSRIRWEARVTPTGPRASRVFLAFEKSGSGSVFGKSASSPLFRAALKAVADRSLERLGEIVADDHEEQRSPGRRRVEETPGGAGPDWERIRSYYALFNDTQQIKAAVERISAGDEVESSGAAGTLDFIDSPYSAHLILASFPLDRRASVIDVGAGLGGSSRLYASTAGRVTAVDILEEQVEAHRALNDAFNARNIDVVRADAQSLPFRDEAFTHYFSIGALCHTFDRRAALSEAHRVLRPGGAIAVVDCVAGPAPGPEYWGERFWKLIPAKEYLSLARQVGFEDPRLSDIRSDYTSQLELYVRVIENTPEIFEVRFGGKERLRKALEAYRGFLEGFRSGRVGVIWLKASRSGPASQDSPRTGPRGSNLNLSKNSRTARWKSSPDLQLSGKRATSCPKALSGLNGLRPSHGAWVPVATGRLQLNDPARSRRPRRAARRCRAATRASPCARAPRGRRSHRRRTGTGSPPGGR